MADTPRQQLVKLQALMKQEQLDAIVVLQEILARPTVKKAITDANALAEKFIPGSTEEGQLSALVNVYNSVVSYFDSAYPPFVAAPETLTPEVTPSAP